MENIIKEEIGVAMIYIFIGGVLCFFQLMYYLSTDQAKSIKECFMLAITAA